MSWGDLNVPRELCMSNCWPTNWAANAACELLLFCWLDVCCCCWWLPVSWLLTTELGGDALPLVPLLLFRCETSVTWSNIVKLHFRQSLSLLYIKCGWTFITRVCPRLLLLQRVLLTHLQLREHLPMLKVKIASLTISQMICRRLLTFYDWMLYRFGLSSGSFWLPPSKCGLRRISHCNVAPRTRRISREPREEGHPP